jgi:hypothetical protein
LASINKALSFNDRAYAMILAMRVKNEWERAVAADTYNISYFCT